MRPQELVCITGVFTIDVGLVEYGEFGTVLLCSELLNLFIGTRFLIHELVTGEC